MEPTQGTDRRGVVLLSAMPTDAHLGEAREVLEAIFGHSDFRPGQSAAIGAALSGADSLVLLPTGSGKSVCYQVPALCASRRGAGTTLVISPLIALMRDQVAALRAKGNETTRTPSGLESESC